MSEIISAVGSLFTAAMGWVGTVATTIAGSTTVEGVTTFNSPVLLLFCVAVPLVGLGIGMFKRLLSSRG